MRRKATASAIHLFRRAFSAISHNLRTEKRRFPPKPKTDFTSVRREPISCVPRIDSSSIREANDAIQLFREMVAMSPQPSFRVYNKLLSVVAKMKEYGVALHMFDEMRHSRFPMNEFTMNIVINCCCHLNRVDLGFAVMGCFLKHNYQLNVMTFNTLLWGFFLVGNVAEAEALFKKVLVSKLCQPNDFMILTMVDGLCKSGQTFKARNLLWDFEKTGYKPDVYSYSAVIDGLCKGGRVDDALHLLFEMPDKGVWPDVVTYNTIIHGLCEDGRVDDALHLQSEMLDKLIRPDVFTYTTIIHGLCEDGRVDDSLHLLSEMLDKLIRPDVVIYNTIIHGLCEDGRVDDTLHLLSEMADKGIRPNVVTFNTIIHSYAQHGFMTKALQIFYSMLRNRIKPDGVTFLAVLSSCAHVGALEEALYHFGSMTKDFGITPGLDHLACLVTLYARKGETKIAYDLVRNFPCSPNKIVWKCILSGCMMNYDLDLARLAAKEILNIDSNDASAYVMLSNIYAGLNMWEEVFKVRELMKEKKVKREIGCSWI